MENGYCAGAKNFAHNISNSRINSDALIIPDETDSKHTKRIDLRQSGFITPCRRLQIDYVEEHRISRVWGNARMPDSRMGECSS